VAAAPNAQQFAVELEIRPSGEHGVVLFAQHDVTRGKFLCLSLYGAVLELRISVQGTYAWARAERKRGVTSRLIAVGYKNLFASAPDKNEVKSRSPPGRGVRSSRACFAQCFRRPQTPISPARQLTIRSKKKKKTP